MPGERGIKRFQIQTKKKVFPASRKSISESHHQMAKTSTIKKTISKKSQRQIASIQKKIEKSSEQLKQLQDKLKSLQETEVAAIASELEAA